MIYFHFNLLLLSNILLLPLYAYVFLNPYDKQMLLNLSTNYNHSSLSIQVPLNIIILKQNPWSFIDTIKNIKNEYTYLSDTFINKSISYVKQYSTIVKMNIEKLKTLIYDYYTKFQCCGHKLFIVKENDIGCTTIIWNGIFIYFLACYFIFFFGYTAIRAVLVRFIRIIQQP